VIELNILVIKNAGKIVAVLIRIL